MAPKLCLALFASFGGSLCASEAGETGTPGELLLLHQLSRHGSRSPKSKYQRECPLDPFLDMWDTWNADLTGPGGKEAAAIGNVTRKMYGTWMGVYDGSRMKVRACDSDRVLQSAEVAMSLLFPAGTGPEHGLPGRPTFVPIHTVDQEEDSLLKIEDGSCHARNKADSKSWWSTTGVGIFHEGQAITVPLTKFCGAAATSNKQLKDQVDGIGFNAVQFEGFGENGYGVPPEDILASQNLSIILQRGDFATDAARTYLAGDLPATLLANMHKAIATDGSDQAEKYIAYFSHRQSLYALAEFFGWQWTQHGIPPGMVQTGTTVWIELRRGAGAGQYDVALLQWAPRCGESNMSNCPAQPIALPGCTRRNGTLCSIEEFGAIVSQRVARTGSWQVLCGAEVAV